MSSPIVEVVTNGIDWPAIVAGISGGVLGLAGIGSTVWQISTGRRREEAHLKREEKRRVYANCITKLNDAMHSAINQQVDHNSTNIQKHMESLAECLAIFHEVSLIGTDAIVKNAGRALFSLTSPSTFSATGPPHTYIGKITDLVKEMRIDLGESPLLHEQDMILPNTNLDT